MNQQFAVDLEKEELIFSAAHFITFGDNICESIHGHNYRVRCRVVGPLNEHGYVVDFIALRDGLRSITRGLDHHVLLPTQHPHIRVSANEIEVEVRFDERRWVFPVADAVLLPVDNTTAERIAHYIGTQLMERYPDLTNKISQLTIAVDENEGQWGECHWQWSTSQ